MSDASGEYPQNKPFSGNTQDKPLRDVLYSEEFDNRWRSRMESQGSLRMYLATLYNERRNLLASLSRTVASAHVLQSTGPTPGQNGTASDPNKTTASSEVNNDGSKGVTVDTACPPFTVEIQNRPLVTFEDLDAGAPSRLLMPTTPEDYERRSARRMEMTQKLDLANLQHEIECLELGNEQLKVRLQIIELGEEVKSQRARVDGMTGREEIKVGESCRGMSEEAGGSQPSIERDHDSGIDMEVVTSTEKDEFASIEKEERERMQTIESTYLDHTTSLQDLTKALEDRMAQSVETTLRERRFDEYMKKAKRDCKAREAKCPFSTKKPPTKFTLSLPKRLNHTEEDDKQWLLGG
ncbi:MAG: hypothetical protein Q9169_000979 [Polycauliona sp. 2 TL-2023]